MRVPRAHIEAELAAGMRVALPEATAHHFLRVLRLPDGAAIRLFNGAPGDWHGQLIVEGKQRASAQIESFEASATESPLELTLVQGISRGQRMDYTLEKCVELGVDHVLPVVMERTQAAPAGERIAKKARHWQGVIAAAAAQSGRTRLPSLAPQSGFREWLEQADATSAPHVLLDPAGDRAPGGIAATTALTLIAGPEGGFSPGERDAAYAAGCRGMRLGPRILRTETAAVAALALLQGLYGDLG
ncbi:MAG: 16S rRNA (uracil(1498)-N(3))-methyltransferase [Halofilum sp. (in: g-proteobacteria)]|nr:16S rRNA (uracil(1498)-N(3))-methyltransferase [Halofilum sp. (in: g-proteobacteria)]